MRSWASVLALLLVACAGPEGAGPDGDDAAPDSEDDASDEGPGAESGGGACSDAIQDGGFEEGPFGEAWAQGSAVFDTVICDASCVQGPAMAYSGSYWVFFGGQAVAESAHVSQTVPIVGTSATLAFYLKIDTNTDAMDSESFTVLLDGENLLTLDNTMAAEYEEYTRVELDISDFAGAASHDLSFDANFSGNTITSFFLDAVEVQACGD